MKNKTKLPKVLFVGDKWCSANFQWGLAEWEGNLWKSLKATGLADLMLFHFDDYYYRFKKLGDEALIKKITKYQPDIICLVIYRIPGSDFSVPKWETFDIIKNRFKIPIIAIWGDMESPETVRLYKSFILYITISAATATSAAINRLNISEKCMYMWAPKDPTIFNNPQKKRDIDVSYVGSGRENRLERVNYLIKNGIDVDIRGGESEEHLSTKKYADIFQRSKITLSFSRARYSHVINARPFEAMNCGAMVLEEEGFETPKLFTPFVDYVPYTSNRDLFEKTRYYLSHDTERERIAENGYKKTSKLYTSKRFWKLMIGRALKTSTQNTNNLLFLKPSNLSHLSHWKRFKFRFLDSLCSNSLGFKLYKTYMIIFVKSDWDDELRKVIFPIYLFFQKNLPPKKFEKSLKILRFIFGIKKK